MTEHSELSELIKSIEKSLSVNNGGHRGKLIAELEKFREIRALLDRPENWTQQAFARRADKVKVSSSDPRAVCWCLEGAVHKTGSSFGAPFLWDKMERHVREHFGFPFIVAFNDAPNRKHGDIIAYLDSLIASTEAEIATFEASGEKNAV